MASTGVTGMVLPGIIMAVIITGLCYWLNNTMPSAQANESGMIKVPNSYDATLKRVDHPDGTRCYVVTESGHGVAMSCDYSLANHR